MLPWLGQRGQGLMDGRGMRVFALQSRCRTPGSLALAEIELLQALLAALGVCHPRILQHLRESDLVRVSTLLRARRLVAALEHEGEGGVPFDAYAIGRQRVIFAALSHHRQLICPSESGIAALEHLRASNLPGSTASHGGAVRAALIRDALFMIPRLKSPMILMPALRACALDDRHGLGVRTPTIRILSKLVEESALGVLLTALIRRTGLREVGPLRLTHQRVGLLVLGTLGAACTALGDLAPDSPRWLAWTRLQDQLLVRRPRHALQVAYADRWVLYLRP